MGLSAYSLASLDELKDYLGGVQGSGRDSIFEAILNRVTDELEAHLGRQIVKRTDPASLTEYHTFQSDGSAVLASELRTLEWPIITITSVHEDSGVPRTYGASALLVESTHYEVVKPVGIIRRIAGLGSPTPWATGHRAVKVVYTAGYADTASVPQRIKAIALRYAALIWAETDRRQFGVSSASDALGNFTRFSSARLTDDMMTALVSERRRAFWHSGERDL